MSTNSTSQQVIRAIQANLYVQREMLGHPTGKLSLIIMSDEGVSYLYSVDGDRAGMDMMIKKLKGLEEKHPDTCQNWSSAFLMKLLLSKYWTPEHREGHRYVFGCCVGEKGVNIAPCGGGGGGKMDHGDWACFFESQDGDIHSS